MSNSQKVWTWSTILRGIALFNILLWTLTCAPLVRGGGVLAWQVGLSGIYVAVCAFRSWLPRVDLERYVLVDSPLSSTFLGRSAATVAEISFAAQIALALHQIGSIAHLPWVMVFAWFVVPTLTLAQVFCWYSVITLNHVGHAVEQSLWTATMGVSGVALVAASPELTGSLQVFVTAGAAFAFVFVAFMVTVDIPMYLRRWREGRARRLPYLSIREGLHDAIHRRVPIREWSKWKPEVAWLTGYFSFAVWLSVALVHFSQL